MTQTLDKLYQDLSQVTRSRTEREQRMLYVLKAVLTEPIFEGKKKLVEEAIAFTENGTNPPFCEGRSFWVVERYNGDQLLYLSGRGTSFEYFEKDIVWALKFANRESGEQVLHRHLNGIGRTVEHAFVATGGQQ